MSATAPTLVNTSRRNLLIAGSVVLFHAAALWALQGGLVRRVAEVVVPVALLSEIVTPPAPKVETPPAPPPPAPPPPAPAPPKPAVKKAQPPAPRPAPRPVARLEPAPAPAPAAPIGIVEPQPPAPPIAAPQAAAPAPVAPAPPPPRIELPSSSAEYLQNPKPPYPPMSKRLGEQGKVVLRVLIGTDGRAQDAEVKQSSGYERLDRTARETVLKWRYVPGKRGGVPEAMWFDVPINFVLE